MKTKTYIAMAVWFLFALAMSIAGQYSPGPGKPPLSLGLTLMLPMLLFVIAYKRSIPFRAFCQSLDLRLLTALHFWRIVGINFLMLYAQGKLPGGFALPAGIGDIIAALSAVPLVIALRKRTKQVRNWFIAWNVFGVADLLVAVGSGILHSQSSLGILASSGPTTQLMSEFPRSLIPTFFVPLFILLHLLALARSNEIAGGAPSTRLRTAEA